MTTEIDDHLAIRELSSRFNFVLENERNADALAELFTNDGVLRLGPDQFNGRDAIRRSPRFSSQPGEAVDLGNANVGQLHRTAHLTTDNLIEVHGDEATQTSYMVVYRQLDLDAGVPNGLLIVTERFDDVLVRTAQGWRFQERVMTILHSNANLDAPARQAEH